jgi:hypothetical protein
MSLTLGEDLRARQIAVGMQFALAGSGAAKTAVGRKPSDFEMQACRAVGELLRSVARGETFLRESETALNSASLSDFRALSVVEAALRGWLGSQTRPPAGLAQLLNGFADRLGELSAGQHIDQAQAAAEFLRFLHDRLGENVCSLTGFGASDVVQGPRK